MSTQTKDFENLFKTLESVKQETKEHKATFLFPTFIETSDFGIFERGRACI